MILTQDPNDRQDNGYTSQRIRRDGLMLCTNRKTCNCVYLPKTPYSERKAKAPKGFNGFSSQQNEHIELSAYTLCIDYGLHNCKWMILTFDEGTSDQALNNLLINFTSLDKAIKYRLNNVYKHHSVKPYFIVYGLKERTSYARGIPCLDINILCAVKDKEGNQLFDESDLIKQIYLAASKSAKETIQMPFNCYISVPYNTLKDYKKLANYLKKQVKLDLLRHFQQSEYASLLPSTYVHVPTSMKETFISKKTKYMKSNTNEHSEVLQEKFADSVTLKKDSNHKLVAQLKNVSTESINDFEGSYQQEYYRRYPDRVALDSPDAL